MYNINWFLIKKNKKKARREIPWLNIYLAMGDTIKILDRYL